jgi:hypothetical protein
MNKFKNCLKATKGLTWWKIAILVALIGSLIVFSGGSIVILGIKIAATFANLGIAVAASAIIGLAICLLN